MPIRTHGHEHIKLTFVLNGRMFLPEDIPYDVLPPILVNLVDRRDLYAAALVSQAFHRAATPYLYARLDSRLIKNELNRSMVVHHPAETLLKRPEYALYVHEVQETGTVQSHHSHSKEILPLSLQALALCKHLRTFSWVDDNFLPDMTFLSFLDVLEQLPLRELTIRTFSNLGSEVWDKLHRFARLERISIWCMEGPPRILQGWSENLGQTLTCLELGRCSGVPATILISVMSNLRNLKRLRLKGAPSNAIPNILTTLPNLLSLDTDYNVSGFYRPSYMPMPRLQTLTVRTSSVDVVGPRDLWTWLRQLIPHCSLRSFTLHSFSTMGEMSIPRRFILDLAEVHGPVLRQFLVGSMQLTLSDVQCLCDKFPGLEELVCSVACDEAKSIKDATAHAFSLRSLKLNVQWFPRAGDALLGRNAELPTQYTDEDATAMMLREGSRLRVIAIGPVMYKGQWVTVYPDESAAGIRFEVSRIHLPDARSET